MIVGLMPALVAFLKKSMAPEHIAVIGDSDSVHAKGLELVE